MGIAHCDKYQYLALANIVEHVQRTSLREKSKLWPYLSLKLPQSKGKYKYRKLYNIIYVIADGTADRCSNQNREIVWNTKRILCYWISFIEQNIFLLLLLHMSIAGLHSCPIFQLIAITAVFSVPKSTWCDSIPAN